MLTRKMVPGVKKIYGKLVQGGLLLGCLLYYPLSFADGLIPISEDEQSKTGTSFTTTITNILKKEVIPVIMIVLSIWIVYEAFSILSEGLRESKEKQKFEPLKDALVKMGVIVVFGGALLYLLQMIGSAGK